MSLSTPVAFVVFNRPEHTSTSFARIRDQRLTQLFLIADGPRPGHETDPERCQQVRAIVDAVDWPCTVHRDYASLNMGCKRRVSSGLDWVFSQVDRAIVLEDDCVPHEEFFAYCEALLERYQDDDRVAAVTGDNFQDGIKRGDGAYYFSKYRDGPHGAVRGGGTTATSVSGQRGRIPLSGGRSTPIGSNGGTGNGSRTQPTGGDTMPLCPLHHTWNIEHDVAADLYTFDHHVGGAALRRRRRPVGFLRWVGAGALRRLLSSPGAKSVRGTARYRVDPSDVPGGIDDAEDP